MEKTTPHHALSVVKAEVIRLGAKAFTVSAMDGGRRLDLSLKQLLRIIDNLHRHMFYKSMTTYADPRVWQDVYHVETLGRAVYINVTYRPGAGAPVISFKEKTQ
ncbi:type II toxin-antitoxin system MqsR family toxin [Pseudomonas sp. MAFF 302046]|uniref:Type II toxin-antitoxin system MqsR family toxin n=1 Tax=Pseudomonas morbosilactucae TaxID=2938197 RepID=A0ABT0JND0_9PSED|nr:type II toxin-antitoxin system MqsR family toxin [Pseudomonas morbosilactucae]MCK9817463.1 type II toxin-antitoxin system MqsR family toxin [Pseudomonas morbosilactucae]